MARGRTTKVKNAQLASISKSLNEHANSIDELEEIVANLILKISSLRKQNIDLHRYISNMMKDPKEEHA